MQPEAPAEFGRNRATTVAAQPTANERRDLPARTDSFDSHSKIDSSASASQRQRLSCNEAFLYRISDGHWRTCKRSSQPWNGGRASRGNSGRGSDITGVTGSGRDSIGGRDSVSASARNKDTGRDSLGGRDSGKDSQRQHQGQRLPLALSLLLALALSLSLARAIGLRWRLVRWQNVALAVLVLQAGALR